MPAITMIMLQNCEGESPGMKPPLSSARKNSMIKRHTPYATRYRPRLQLNLNLK